MGYGGVDRNGEGAGGEYFTEAFNSLSGRHIAPRYLNKYFTRHKIAAAGSITLWILDLANLMVAKRIKFEVDRVYPNAISATRF